MVFNKDEHIMQIKSSKGSSDYLPVAWRLVWFREKCPQGTIETEMVLLDLDKEVQEEAYVWSKEKNRSEKVTKMAKGIAIFRAIVKDGQGGIATGTKQENAASFPDFIEKAETGSIGRALAALGYGTQFAPDFDEQHRIVDSPVERQFDENQGRAQQPATQRQPVQQAKAIRTRPCPSQDQLKAEVAEMKILNKSGQIVTWAVVVATALQLPTAGAAANMMGKRTLTMAECEKIDDLIQKEREVRSRAAEQQPVIEVA